MLSIKLDKVIFSSLHEAYKNYKTTTGTINVSGSVSNGATENFSSSTPYTRSGTRADIYVAGSVTDVKTLANSGSRVAATTVYSRVSSETSSILVDYDSDEITVTLSIFNGTGSGITLTTQVITVSLVQYDAPIQSL